MGISAAWDGLLHARPDRSATISPTAATVALYGPAVKFSPLLYLGREPGVLRPAPTELTHEHEWKARDDGSITHRLVTMVTAVRHPATTREPERLTCADYGVMKRVQFRPAQALTRLVQVWQGNKPWRPAPARYRECVARDEQHEGERARDKTREMVHVGAGDRRGVCAGLEQWTGNRDFCRRHDSI